MLTFLRLRLLMALVPFVQAGWLVHATSNDSDDKGEQAGGAVAWNDCQSSDNKSCAATGDVINSTQQGNEQKQRRDQEAETPLQRPTLPPEEDGVVKIAYGEPQKVDDSSPDVTATRNRLYQAHAYMEDTVFSDPEYAGIKFMCQNRHELCTFWASIDECEANPAYMTLNCAPACFACDQLIFEKRCPYDANAPGVWQSGDLNKMFERITSDPFYEQYRPNILARPGQPNPRTGDSPWVITLDSFLSKNECDALIELGGVRGYEISKDVGKKNFDGTYAGHANEGRTSTNAWCVEECYENPVVQNVIHRMENLTGIPDANAEYLQLLKYEEGQFYRVHHDYVPHHTERAQGVRILTVFLYLNDVEAGGGTDFPELDLTVMPSVGKALIWPSVKDHLPDYKDSRTDHQALPVEKGVKYGANAWLHQRDFKTPYQSNCI